MTENIETRLRSVVCTHLRIAPERYSEDLTAGEIPEWDSIAHVGLIMAVEAEFGIAFDVTDAVDVETAGDLLALVGRYLPNEDQ